MNKYVLTAAMAVALGMTSGMAMAEHHEGGDHKGGKMMERIDTDGDGKISKAEFMAKHEEKFTQMDKNSDGFLTPEEIKEAHESMKEKWKERKEMRKEKMKDAE